MKFEATLLGSFAVRRNGQDLVEWPRAAPKRLFKMLAVAPQHTLPVEQVAAAFWPNDWRDQVRQRLHHVVYLLRAFLSGGDEAAGRLVEIRDGMVRLVVTKDLASSASPAATTPVPTLCIDADQFEAALTAVLAIGNADSAALTQVLDRYAGPLLAGDTQDEPVVRRRDHLQRQYVHGLHVLARQQLADDALDSAAHTLTRVLTTAPTDEDAHRALMDIHAQRGQLDQVERQFSVCKATLLRELGVPPSAQTHQRYRAAMLGPSKPDTAHSTEQAPPRPTDARRRLQPPLPLVTLIDRDALRDRTMALLRQPMGRLVTLVGQGGMGKTQLALTLAHTWSQQLGLEACFVSLAEVGEDGVLDRTRRALRVPETAGTDTEEAITDFLRPLELLLVMDSCEHVLPSLGVLTRLLSQCPQLVVLTTSRRPLNLGPERVVAVPALRATQDSAVRLFVERAQAVAPDFGSTALAHAADIQAIVEQLEGLPLAIELVAARAHSFDPAELRRALAMGFGAVAGGGPDRPMRHRSLEESFAWSRQLLTATEQSVLQRAAQFAAPFEQKALSAICADLPGPHVANAAGAPRDAMPHMSAIVQSLVELGFLRHVAAIDGGEDVRWRLPAAAREFLVSPQTAGTSDDESQRRFVAWFAALAQSHDAKLAGPEAAQTLRRLEADHDNFFAALAFAKVQGDDAALTNLVQGLVKYWTLSGAWQRADAWVRTACEVAPRLPPTSRAAVLLSAAGYAMDYQRYAVAQALALEAGELARDAGALALQARAANMHCAAVYHLGQADKALALLTQTLAAALATKQDTVAAAVQNNMATCWLTGGELLRARAAWRACDRLFPDELQQARVPFLFNLALVAHYRGEHDDAARWVSQAMACENSGLARPARLAFMGVRTSWMWSCRADATQAEQVLQRAADAAEASGLVVWQRVALAHAGKVALVRGQSQLALGLLQRGVAACQGLADPWDLLDLQLWLFWAQASQPDSAEDARATLMALLTAYQPSWRHEHARLLEATAAWLVQDKQWLPAARIWQQAQTLRKQQGVRRFEVEQAWARRTRSLLRSHGAQSEGDRRGASTLGDGLLDSCGAVSQALLALRG
jgi:predicted ATPase/DNA-binding SARP family transcriptional activator